MCSVDNMSKLFIPLGLSEAEHHAFLMLLAFSGCLFHHFLLDFCASTIIERATFLKSFIINLL